MKREILNTNVWKSIIYVMFVATGLIFSLPAHAGENGPIADTPWPMYQHDPQHTGRSPFIGPQHQPELMWSIQLPGWCHGEAGGMSLDKDGNILLSLGGCLYSINPMTRAVNWFFPGDNSRSVALVGADGNIYWGYGVVFAQIAPDGVINWEALLDPNYVFGSSATFGPDGNLYFVHDGLWSFTPSGGYRWFNPYGELGTHAAPAIGLDGNIYASGATDLVAYLPDGSVAWSVDTPHESFDYTPSVGTDGTIYIAAQESAVYAINPGGTIKWEFHPFEGEYNANIYLGIALGLNNSINFVWQNYNTGITHLYSVAQDGSERWNYPITPNLITGFPGRLYTPFSIDQGGSVFVCPTNSRCYGISSDGGLLWEYEFTLTDSIPVLAKVQPLLAANGLYYVVDNHKRLYAFADSATYPVLNTPVGEVGFQVDMGDLAFSYTLPITSTVSPITYSVELTTVSWLSISQEIRMTPVGVTMNFSPTMLTPGIYQTSMTVVPIGSAGKRLDIPVSLKVGTDDVFLPLVFTEYKPPYRIVYGSTWFNEGQLASIEQTGKDRREITHDLPNQVTWSAYAPDGMKVALVAYVGGQYKIFIVDLKTGETFLEIATNMYDMNPSWSPSSNQLIFLSAQDEPLNGEVYKINLDGSGLTRLTHNQLYERGLFWSPAGDKIALHVWSGRTFIMKADGSNFHQLFSSSFYEEPVGWSPDGRLLMTHVLQPGMVNSELWVYDFMTGSHTRLLSPFPSYELPVWSPDGTHIVYVGGDPGNNDIFVMKADGSGIVNLSVDTYKDMQPVWSPDSQWIAFTKLEGEDYNIYIVHPDGTGLFKVTSNISTDSMPFWQPYHY